VATDDVVRGPVLTGESVQLRPVLPEDRPRLLEIRHAPEVRRWWGTPSDDDEELDTHRFAVLHDGAVVGLVQYGEELDPMYRHANVDIYLDPAAHGRGLGRDAVRTLARYLFSTLGHHRIVIDPAAANERAISTYAAVGFRAVGVLRAYERDPEGVDWHDGLLMEMLSSDLT
jgi:aminoglycoside 6'-N-acetyltransferase